MFFGRNQKRRRGPAPSEIRTMGKRRNVSRSRWSLFLSRLFFIFSFLAFLGVIGYALFFSDFLEVAAVSVSGAESVNPEKIEAAFKNEISGRYFNLIPRNNLLLIGKKQTGKFLTDRFKQIENAEIRKKFPHQILIFILERKSMLVFCAGENCYLLDGNGKAFLPVRLDEDELNGDRLAVFREDKEREISLNDEVVERERLEFILGIKGKMENDAGLKIKNEYGTPSLASSDIRVETEEGWRVFLNSDIRLEKEIESLKAVLEKSLSGEDRKNLEYIDLRTENRAYYKLKNAQ